MKIMMLTAVAKNASSIRPIDAIAILKLPPVGSNTKSMENIKLNIKKISSATIDFDFMASSNPAVFLMEK